LFLPYLDLNNEDKDKDKNNNEAMKLLSLPNLMPLIIRHPTIDLPGLAHDRIFPSYPDAATHDFSQVIKLLLHDLRVSFTTMTTSSPTFTSSSSLLWRVCHEGDLSMVKWMVASGRNIGVELPCLGMKTRVVESTPYRIAEEKGHDEVLKLIKDLMKNPVETRKAVRAELGITG
jgi:hypothetical protein